MKGKTIVGFDIINGVEMTGKVIETRTEGYARMYRLETATCEHGQTHRNVWVKFYRMLDVKRPTVILGNSNGTKWGDPLTMGSGTTLPPDKPKDPDKTGEGDKTTK